MFGLLVVLCATGKVWADGGAELRDPTRPSGWQVPQAGGNADGDGAQALKLQGTFNVGGLRSALVNGQRVRVGDLVAGAEVVDIRADKVVLDLNGERRELMAGVFPVKHPVSAGGGR
jgi:hypothetical protein